MSIESTAATDDEAERQEQLADLIAEHGANWLEEFKPGTFGCHELLDRAAFFAKTVEVSLLSHPACVQNQDWYALANQAFAALWDLYQRIGAEHLGRKENSPS
ncbi:MAG TPA: hypothetical protein VKI65_15575 [Gemmataceae bacterium]|nr:hypothetical protein [Gemmataceae bacterium]